MLKKPIAFAGRTVVPRGLGLFFFVHAFFKKAFVHNPGAFTISAPAPLAAQGRVRLGNGFHAVELSSKSFFFFEGFFVPLLNPPRGAAQSAGSIHREYSNLQGWS